MILEVSKADLPVGEHLLIQKNRIQPEKLTGKEKRIAIVTGTHGDELEGQFVCCELQRRIHEHPEYLKGIVDVYPALNPLGIESITRSIPIFDLDMNRIFPGNREGGIAENCAADIIEDIRGADVCVDIHSSNIFLMEIPQVRINELTADTLVPLAKHLNVDFVWVHASATVLESTLAYSLNQAGVPTLVVEMGVGMRITRKYCDQLTEGLFNLMKELGMWEGETGPVIEPVISTDHQVGFLNANTSGIFVPSVEHGDYVRKGQHMGDILHPLTGETVERVCACMTGMVFTRREYPIVYSGSLLARILGGVIS
ncbi:MAG: M14 family metallopeptidase [Marvinbryantia sp.]|uniref:M14 family metallopeptidase n=1 Tax=Marvinbryantia sp. TaxID=2496532 RepID=UPI0025D06064|nr:M14 family metallopeptidase [uncultured Marvinbryantia sp.]